MKAKDLIKILEQDPEAEVLVSGVDCYDSDYSTQLNHNSIKHFKRGEECDIDFDDICSENKVVNTNCFIIE